ncbi:MAG: hypothetical protein Crog4KO_19200 [Crocinitomicaceae bacterium]
MAFNGKEGGAISIEQGADMTARYRDDNPGDIKGHFYGKDILKQLLNQEGAMGIRIYYGIDENGKKELVLVSADADENDNLDLVVDLSQPCPPDCGAANDLNS